MPISLTHDAWGRLVLVDPAGATHTGVIPVRAFPVAAPDEGLSILGANGKEVLWIPRLADLEPAAREIIEQELAQREFVPIMRRIVEVSGNIEPAQWTIETDRGTTRFVLKTEDDIRRLGDQRAMITDADGVRYLIPDVRRLDAFSRRVLERYL